MVCGAIYMLDTAAPSTSEGPSSSARLTVGLSGKTLPRRKGANWQTG